MIKKHSTKLILAILVFTGVIVGGSVVLLTPLRFVNLIEPKITEISPAAFSAEFNQNPNNYVFIDVRPQEQYVAEHPTGAINVPLEKLYSQRHFLPKYGKTIALICGGNQASGVAFSYLQHFGFFNLVRIPGGLPAWKAAGLPTVVGNSPYEQNTASLPVSFGAMVAPRCS